MRRSIVVRTAAPSAAALALLAVVTVPLSAQLGARPAEEWALTLESGRRMSSLEIDEVVARIGLQAGEIVADIGAGTGIFSIPLARAVGPNGRVYSVEIDEGFLPIIQRKASEQGVGNVTTVLGEFTDPKLPRRDVDVAFFHDVLHHIQDRAGYIQALSRYLGPGARIVVVDYNGNTPGVPHANQPEMLITPEEVAGWMADAGFPVTRSIGLFGEDKFFVVYSRR